MNKISFLALSLLVASVAQARPSTYKMTCAQAADLVKSSRGIVMNYGYSSAAGHLYDMFYPTGSFCANAGYDADSAYVKTTDSDSCRVGYVCSQSNRGN